MARILCLYIHIFLHFTKILVFFAKKSNASASANVSRHMIEVMFWPDMYFECSREEYLNSHLK